ncbi:MAG: VWA domain-containing protein [Saprospiraceae bacterium]|nr:VWA domain-containing protein [Saprospiraceae bacterium]
MLGWQFTKYNPDTQKSKFDELLSIFQELLIYSAGEVANAIQWLMEMDRDYEITSDDYGIRDFLDELAQKGFLSSDLDHNSLTPTAKMNVSLRKKALKEVFGAIQKSGHGNHNSRIEGKGDEYTSDIRPYNFGDNIEQIAFLESLKNAQINHGIDNFDLGYDDLEIRETYHQSNMSSVLLIDISHSMILYGEDRITPAKKVAMALSEYISTRFPKDSLDIVVFGDEAWKIEKDELPYLEVGPYHTNTLAALELALDILQKKKNTNKQVFMITDGKPTCIKRGGKLYKNSFGLDRIIVNRTLNQASKFRRLGIPITTFMIAKDPYLVQFVESFTEINGGRAFYSDLYGLGDFIFKDYKRAKKKSQRK